VLTEHTSLVLEALEGVTTNLRGGLVRNWTKGQQLAPRERTRRRS